jgi:Ca2+-dependent lipid-binding protein
MPNSSSLRVRLSHAIGLRSMDSNGYSGPYVKLTLGKETHKSEIVKKSLNPRWDKDYFFRGGFEQLVALPLQVHAWDYDRLSIRNDPLGNGSICVSWTSARARRSTARCSSRTSRRRPARFSSPSSGSPTRARPIRRRRRRRPPRTVQRA